MFIWLGNGCSHIWGCYFASVTTIPVTLLGVDHESTLTGCILCGTEHNLVGLCLGF